MRYYWLDTPAQSYYKTGLFRIEDSQCRKTSDGFKAQSPMTTPGISMMAAYAWLGSRRGPTRITDVYDRSEQLRGI